jgi:hypothetical protein
MKIVKNVALVFCLFTFLLIVLGGGLRLNPGGAFIAAATGTPLVVYGFRCLAPQARGFIVDPEENKSAKKDEPALVIKGRK